MSNTNDKPTPCTKSDLQKLLEAKYSRCHETNERPKYFEFLEEQFDTTPEESLEPWECLLIDERNKSACSSTARVAGEARRDHGDGSRRPHDPLPPLTNRGLTKYQSQSPSNSQPMNLKELIQSEIDSEELQRGGYDGGLTIGFNGIWEIYDFEQLVALLEQKKTEAADSSSGYAETIIGGIPFLVKASGTHEGVHYRYIIEGAGLKFLIRHQANEKVQDVRLRYGAESLIGRDFYYKVA